jgi:hypothetical protein
MPPINASKFPRKHFVTFARFQPKLECVNKLKFQIPQYEALWKAFSVVLESFVTKKWMDGRSDFNGRFAGVWT